MNFREMFRVAGGDSFNLAGSDPGRTPGVDDEETADGELSGSLGDRLFDVHDRLMAERSRSVLLILQGTDASGKSGTIKHVVRRMNPVGVRVAGFVEPTDEEEQHHFLWRVRQELPGSGVFGVFDRSHYEDVLVPRVDGELDGATLEERLAEILEFERGLVDSGMTIVKCFLDISYDEQRERFLRRLRREDKQWKFTLADLETRRDWDRYQAAFADTIVRTDRDRAPWYVIPADHKWYRNWAIAHLLVETMDEMDLRYPSIDGDVDELRAALAAPR